MCLVPEKNLTVPHSCSSPQKKRIFITRVNGIVIQLPEAKIWGAGFLQGMGFF